MNKKMKTLLYSFLSISFLVHSCVKDPVSSYYDYRLKLINNSNTTICSYYSFSYPDTSLQSGTPKNSIDANHQFANKGETITFVRGGVWENTFKDQIPSGKLMIYVLDNTVFNTVPWDTIKKKYMILKRYTVTEQDLENMKWTINYP